MQGNPRVTIVFRSYKVTQAKLKGLGGMPAREVQRSETVGKHMGRPMAAGAAIALSLACAAPATAGAEGSSAVDWAHLFGDAGSSTVSTMCDSVNQTQR